MVMMIDESKSIWLCKLHQFKLLVWLVNSVAPFSDINGFKLLIEHLPLYARMDIENPI